MKVKMNTYLNTTLRNIAWFKKTNENGELDVKPPFQRNPVWVTRQKGYLIDTILNGFPIPEIYMQETIDGSGNSKYIIVDGQQRIRAILEFIEGKYSMDEKDSPNFSDMSFDDLSAEQKQEIFQYNFVVRILPPIPDVELREIFQRLNKNVVALNKQELRQATYWGPFIKTMNQLSNKDAWTKIDVFTANDIRRMIDVEYISELSIAVLHGLQNKKDNLDKFYQIYEEEFESKDSLINCFDVVLGETLKILPDISKSRWGKKSDFYSLFVVFSEHADSFPLTKEKREQANVKLLSFSNDIDLYVKTNKEQSEEDHEFPNSVKTYTKGIRATTDLGSRKNRAQGINMILNDLW